MDGESKPTPAESEDAPGWPPLLEPVRIVLSDVRLDPILSPIGGRISLQRLFIRPYNEALPLEFVPGNVLTRENWRKFGEAQEATIPGWNEQVRTRLLHLQDGVLINH